LNEAKSDSIYPALKARRLTGFAYFCLLACILLGYLFFSGRLFLAHSFFYGSEGNTFHFSDFVHFYQDGQLVLGPDRTKIYDASVQLKLFNDLIKPVVLDKVPISQYSPVTFCLMAPFALFSMEWAFVAWCALSLLIGISGLWCVWKSFGREEINLPFFVLGVCASFPAWWTLHIGQLSWFLLGLICFATCALKDRRHALQGALLSFFAVKPHYGFFFASPFVGLRYWRVFWAAVVFELALLAGTALLVGPDNVINYPRILYKLDTSDEFLGVNPASMVSIRGPLSLILPQSLALPIATAFMLLGLAACIEIWLKASANREHLLPWAMALTVVYCLTLSPHTHPYDCLLLALSALLTLPSVSLFDCAKAPTAPEKIWNLLLVLYPFISFLAFLYWDIVLSGAMNQASPLFFVNVILLLSGTAHYLAMLSGEEKQSKAKSLAS
jgi:hypothetical protein